MEKKSASYFLHSISNFIAAFGGGIILGKSTTIIDTPLLQGDPLLAFFTGTVIGLILLQLIPNTLSKPLGRWFSILGGITSVILINLFIHYAVQGKLSGAIGYVFFILLSTRFAFWFYSRVLRASKAAGHQQKIAWVELGYYIGMILGLIIWKFIHVEITLIAAFIMDAIVQFIAGIMDLYASHLVKNNASLIKVKNKEINLAKPKLDFYKKCLNWKLISSVMLLSISLQATVFNITHHVSETFSPFILAIFYFGVAVGAVTYKKLQIQFEWSQYKNSGLSRPILSTDFNGKKNNINFTFINMISVSLVFIAVLLSKHSSFIPIQNQLIFLSIVCLSAALYEILALSIIDRIAIENRASSEKDWIVMTYGFMGIAVAVSLWIFGITENTLHSLLHTLLLCFLLTFLATWRRDSVLNLIPADYKTR